MIKKIFLSAVFIGLALWFTNPVRAANITVDYNAELTKNCKPSHCVVPVPTLINPQNSIIEINKKIYLTGLTWNNTKISIYLDNKYQGRATVVNDQNSDTANFYYLIDKKILVGHHEWQVIAWTENMRRRSYLSTSNSFTIRTYFAAPHLDQIREDIDHNNWLIGKVKSDSLVKVYVDNQYQGQLRTTGNFNYNLGHLPVGQHNFYVLAQEISTGRMSKKSNILSKQISEPVEATSNTNTNLSNSESFNSSNSNTPSLDNSNVKDSSSSLEEPKTAITREIKSVKSNSKPEAETPINVKRPRGQISSISEKKEENGEITIKQSENKENVKIVDVEDSENLNQAIDVRDSNDIQNQLVVDNSQKIKNKNNNENNQVKTTNTENLQSANLDKESKDLIMSDLNISAKQERNRKIGLWLLVVLIAVVFLSTIWSNKKKTSTVEESLEDNHNPDQKNLFDKK